MNKYLVTGILLALITFLFSGVYQDPEFGELTLFMKHKPSLQFRFYSPIGESDLTIKDLSSEKQKAEIAFAEFVTARRGQFVFERLDLLPFIFISLSVTFLLIGLIVLKTGHKPAKSIAILYFVIIFVLSQVALIYL
jgi:hypothetical protein